MNSPANRAPRHRRRRAPRILFWYIAREFSVPLACCLGGFIALFVVNDILDDLPDFLEVQAPAHRMLLYFLLRQPANLVHILPMSILLSCSFMINTLARHHETTALRASGLSLMRCCLPIWLIALAAAGLSFGLTESIAPECSARAKDLLDTLTTHGYSGRTNRTRLAYRNGDANRDWFFETFDLHGKQAGVVVTQFAPDGTVYWELRAAAATFSDDRWHFRDATLTHADDQGKLLADSEKTVSLYVPAELRETPREILNSLKPAEELSVREMLKLLRSNRTLPRSTQRVFLTTAWYRSAFPFSCLVAALLGVGLSITRENHGALRGFATAVGLMVVYYLAGQLFLLLGKAGSVPPVIAGALPTLAFILWGSREMYLKR